MKDKNLLKKFGKKVKVERIKKDMTQNDLAFFSNINRITLSKIENGEVAATLDTIEKIASGLHIPIVQLFDF